MSRMQAKALHVSKPKQVPDRDRVLVSRSPLTFDTPDFECLSSWRTPSSSLTVSSKPFKGRFAGRVHTVGSEPKMAKAQGRTMSVSSDDSSGSSVGESVGLVDLRSTKRELL